MNKFKTGELLGKASRLLSNRLSNRLAESNAGVTSEQWILLQILKENPKTQKELCEITLKNKSSINSLISNLIKSNFVTKTVLTSDKRNTLISISELGIKVKKESNKIALETIERATNGFSENEIEQLNSYLTRIKNNLNR